MQTTNTSADFALIRQRLSDWLAEQPINANKSLAALQALRPDGTWPDIDYANRDGGSWEPFEHLDRMRNLVILFRSDGSAELGTAVRKALIAWVERDPQSDNWWYNFIGTPQEVGTVLLLMCDVFLPGEVPGSLEIVRRARTRPGPERTHQVRIGLIAAVLAEDEAGAEAVLSLLWPIVRVGGGEGIQAEGIQADASYHFHGPQLYSGGYGRSHGMTIARLMAVVAGTRFAAPPETLEAFSHFILDGSQWMLRGEAFEVTSRGRETSRPEEDMRPVFATICRNMLSAGAPREAEWQAFLSRLEAPSPSDGTLSLHGARHFWKSDLLVRQSPRYFGSVKMNSIRTFGTEEGNGEGLTNYLLLFGCSLLMQRGDEYKNIYPVWDWHRLPGATCTAAERVLPPVMFGISSEGTTRFVGGVTDGSGGLSAWILDRDGVHAHKACALLENVIVAAGAGLSGPEDELLQTGVNQCWLNGEVWVKDALGVRLLSEGDALSGIEWVWHDGVGYCFAPGQTVILRVGPQSGGWERIMNIADALEYQETLPRDLTERPILSLWIEHGCGVQNGFYEYAIFPGIPLEDMPRAAADSTEFVVENSTDAQAFWDKSTQRTLCAFYAPGSAAEITVSHPCLVIGQDQEEAVVTLCNPANEALSVSVKHKQHTGTVFLPTGLFAGSSVTQRLQS